MGDLVLDHVVEDLLGRKQQPPVEAHRSIVRAARPAGPLAADRQSRVARARPGDGGVEPVGLDPGVPRAVGAADGIRDRGLAVRARGHRGATIGRGTVGVALPPVRLPWISALPVRAVEEAAPACGNAPSREISKAACCIDPLYGGLSSTVWRMWRAKPADPPSPAPYSRRTSSY